MPKGYDRKVALPPPRVGPPPPPPEFTCDDPEGHEWFARLPAAAQEEYRAHWAAAAARDAKREKLAKDTLRRSILQGIGLMVVSETLGAMPSIWHTALAIPAGAALGAVWHRTGAGRYRCMTTALLPFVLLRTLFFDASSSWALGLSCITAVVGLLFLTVLAAFIGVVRERRVIDDLDH
jgi:hypothetical protein